ncbi:hypothetical protein ACFVWT_19335 [Arthrobacter sp. NPDC058288]|jgi:hypothetical protein|uniref:hypothetical protein n=1 Tax=Arthrobacter sp. NPDC058288 TaxID=3346424 RepID=UPI0036E1AC6B
MTASAKRLVMTFLRRAGGLAAVLAVIAGILGMHVMTGDHSMPSPAAMTTTTAGAVHNTASPPDGHSGHQVSGGHSTQEASVQDVTGSPSEPCSGSCTSMQTMTVSCTPSAKSGSLTAPLPGTTLFGVIPGAGLAGARPNAYSYLPGGPSPGELSISRT